MNKDYLVFLQHILESIKAIETYTKDITEEEFLDSLEKQDAVIRRLEIIGETVRNLPEEFRKEHPNIPWNKAMGIRNLLIHNYFGVDLVIVWDTITQSLPEFKQQIINLV